MSRQVFNTSAAHSSVEAELEKRKCYQKKKENLSALQTHLNQINHVEIILIRRIKYLGRDALCENEGCEGDWVNTYCLSEISCSSESENPSC